MSNADRTELFPFKTKKCETLTESHFCSSGDRT